MERFEQLVEALRCKRDDCEGCDLAFFDNDEGWICQYAAKDDDAADAIEAMQAQLPKRGEIVRCGECKYWMDIDDGRQKHEMCAQLTPNWFCADGEREVQE